MRDTKKMVNKQKGRALGATRLVTGHNLDDAAQTVLMNYFKGNLFIGINEGPKVGITNDKKFVQRVKPLYFIREKEVEKYSRAMKFPVIYERCPCVVGAYRHRIRNYLDKFESSNKNGQIKENIVHAYLNLLPKLRTKSTGNKLVYCKTAASQAETLLAEHVQSCNG